MKTRRILAVLLLLAALCGLFTGCAKEQKTDPSSGFTPSMDTGAEKSLLVNGSWSNFQALEEIINDWNEIYPNVSVEYKKVDGYYMQLDSILAGENPPEIIMLDIDGFYTNKEAVMDALLDLSDIGLDLSLFDERTVAASTAGGKLCTLPWGLLTNGFVVNKTLLAQYGLDVPKTQSELAEACKLLAENGYVPIQSADENFYQLFMSNECDYRLETASEAEREALRAAAPGCGKLYEQEFKKMFELTADGAIDAKVNREYENVYEYCILRFLDGELPFLAFSTEGFSGIKKRESQSEHFTAEPFEYEFDVLPVSVDEPVMSVSYLLGLSIVSGTENEEWAKEFLRFVCQETELEKMARVKGVPSVTLAGGENPSFAQLYSIPADRRVMPDTSDFTLAVQAAFSNTTWKIATGKVSTLEEAEQSFEEDLKNQGGIG